MIGHEVTVSGLPVVRQVQYFRPEAVIAACRQGGRLQPHQSRFFVLYRDPSQQYGCGRMPLDVKTFPQAVRATEALGVQLLKREFACSQGVDHVRLNRHQIGGLEVHGDSGFIVDVRGIQYLNRFNSLGTVEEFLRELPAGIADRFVELVEPNDEVWWRRWYDCPAIQKVRLAPSQYGQHFPCVQVFLDGAWQELRTTDLEGVIAKIESAGTSTTCLRKPK